MLQNKEQTFLLAHRAIMFPIYVRRCLILPVPNSLTVACPFLDQYSLQWYHTGQEKPENKKQTNVIGYTVWHWEVFLKNWKCSFYHEFEVSAQQPLCSWFGNSLCTPAFTQTPTETWHWIRLIRITAWLPSITSPDADILSVDPKFMSNNMKHKGSEKSVLHSVWTIWAPF